MAGALTTKEVEALAASAFETEAEIKRVCASVITNWWELAELLYELSEDGGWKLLGHESLAEFLAQPDIGISRSGYFQMTRAWRDLVITRGVDPDELRQLEPSKVREVVPAIMAGNVSIEDAFADAKILGHRDMREKYRDPGGHDQKLDAAREPERVQCESCGGWCTVEELREWANKHGS